MRKNTHRYTINTAGSYLGNRRRLRDFVFQSYNSYNAYHNSEASKQLLDAICLNPLDKGNAEDQRIGHTVFAKELRVKLNLRSFEAAELYTPHVSFNRLSLVARTDDTNNFPPVRNYQMNIKRAGLTVGGFTSLGEVAGIDIVGEATEVTLVSSEMPVTCTGDDGHILINDTKPGKPTLYGGVLETVADELLRPDTIMYTQKPIVQMRILIVKYYDLVLRRDLDPDDILGYFLPLPEEDVPDFYGPTQKLSEENPVGDPPNVEYAEITYQTGATTTTQIPLTASLLPAVYKQVDILYDKIVTFTAEQPVFTLDEVWKLNETVSWMDTIHYPIDNGVFLIMYDAPSSRRIDLRTDTRSWLCMDNIISTEISTEFYYDQPQ